jgi:hypothetical protein
LLASHLGSLGVLKSVCNHLLAAIHILLHEEATAIQCLPTAASTLVHGEAGAIHILL